MAKTFAQVETPWGPVLLTQFVGPARVEDRRCLQIGDGIRLTPMSAGRLVDELERWIDGLPLPTTENADGSRFPPES